MNAVAPWNDRERLIPMTLPRALLQAPTVQQRPIALDHHMNQNGLGMGGSCHAPCAIAAGVLRGLNRNADSVVDSPPGRQRAGESRA